MKHHTNKFKSQDPQRFSLESLSIQFLLPQIVRNLPLIAKKCIKIDVFFLKILDPNRTYRPKTRAAADLQRGFHGTGSDDLK
ncbi:MAG: hypothetical protein KBD78_11045 [Oligoflexales bacterium]|nr:hypothetical protein [Oligoflexales bacterium]